MRTSFIEENYNLVNHPLVKRLLCSALAYESTGTKHPIQ